MSVILVTFPNAPKISEAAIKKVHVLVLLRVLVELLWYIVMGIQAMRECVYSLQ